MHINEIFTSLSGEADGFDRQGCLATFVRLQGCNLHCKWCDTKYASGFDGWEDMTVEEVVAQCPTRHVVITGGEPLLQQKDVNELVHKLVEHSFSRNGHDYGAHTLITIETNGSIPILIDQARCWYNFLRFVVDYKLDSSGVNSSMLPEIFGRLAALDVIKFVIADLQDYRQAKDTLSAHPRWCAQKVFSPVPKKSWPTELAKAIIGDKLEDVRFSLQLHKMVNIM